LDIVFFKPMRTIIIAGFVIALASGLFLNYAGHPWQVFAQTNSPSNATQGSTGANKGGNATSQQQGASGGGAGGNATTTPSSTVSTVKGGPKQAGSASQLQQITGPNASQILSSNAPLGNKPGLQGLSAESTTTSQKNATSTGGSAGQSASSGANKTSAGASSAGKNATSAAGSAANKTSAGASSAGKNATGGGGGGQAQNNTNPLAKIPVIGQLFGGGGGGK
jgi:hypothetical protein